MLGGMSPRSDARTRSALVSTPGTPGLWSVPLLGLVQLLLSEDHRPHQVVTSRGVVRVSQYGGDGVQQLSGQLPSSPLRAHKPREFQ